jgi:hypothetical protein
MFESQNTNLQEDRIVGNTNYSKLFDESTDENKEALAYSKKLMSGLGEEPVLVDGLSMAASDENIKQTVIESPEAVLVNFADTDPSDDELAKMAPAGTDLGNYKDKRNGEKEKRKQKNDGKLPAKQENRAKSVQLLQEAMRVTGGAYYPTDSKAKYNINEALFDREQKRLDPTYNYSATDKLQIGRSNDEVLNLQRAFIGPDGKEHSLEEVTDNNIWYDEKGEGHILTKTIDPFSSAGWSSVATKLSADVKPSDILSVYNAQAMTGDGTGTYFAKKFTNGLTSATMRAAGSVLENLWMEDLGRSIQNSWSAGTKWKETFQDEHGSLHTGDGFFDYNAKYLTGSILESVGAMIPGFAVSALSGSVLAGSVLGGITMGDQINQEMRELGIDGNTRKAAFWATVAMGTVTEFGIGEALGVGFSSYAKLLRPEQQAAASGVLHTFMGRAIASDMTASPIEREIGKSLIENGYKNTVAKFAKEGMGARRHNYCIRTSSKEVHV